MGIATLTTSLVWREVNRRSHKSRLKRLSPLDKIEVVAMSAETLTEVAVLKQSLPLALSLQDASVLHLAVERAAVYGIWPWPTRRSSSTPLAGPPGWSQVGCILGVRCHCRDIGENTISKIEAQVRCVKDSEIVYLAKALKVKEQDLFPSKG